MSQRTRAHTTGAATHKPPERAKHKKNAKEAKKTSEKKAGPPATDGAQSTAGPEVAAQQGDQSQASLSPETLARTLRAVAAELERDPELARRISGAIISSEAMPSVPSSEFSAHSDSSSAANTADQSSSEDAPSQARPRTSTFRPRLITGANPDLGPGIPDPFALLAKRGEAGLRAVLEELRLGTLRAIIRTHGLDQQGKVTRQNDATKLRALILEAVIGRDK